MNETTLIFWIIVLFALRIGLPFIVTIAGGYLLNARIHPAQDVHRTPK